MLQSAKAMAHDAFISYSSKDKTIADAVCARLEARGIRCWIAPRDVQPGAPYGEEIIDAINSARAMVLVLSANANASPHIPKEVERAVSNGVPVIPLRVENVMPAKSLDYFISSVHWLDAITPPLESHLESLATTILTLLPKGAQKAPPSIPVQPAPSAPAPRPAPTSPSPAKPQWLWPAVAGSVIVLAVGGWFWFGRPNPQPNNVPIVNANDGLPPSSVNPGETPPPAMGVPSKADPLVGCWHWMNNATVVVSANGTMTAGPFTAHWRAGPGRMYSFRWPAAVDSVTLSTDHNTLSGSNQYGVPMSATRTAPGPGMAGIWHWYNGAEVNILQNGDVVAVPFSAHWAQTGVNMYSITWPDPIDTVSMTADHQEVRGANQYGFPVSGTKMAACGG